MLIAVGESVWERYDDLSSQQLAQELLKLAAKVAPQTLRKHPRGAKVVTKKGYAPGHVARRHVATSRVLERGKVC